jgi:hypothetical protein
MAIFNMKQPNITNQEKPLNMGSPAQPVDDKPLIDDKTTMAEAYKITFELKLNKLSKGDREYFLANQSKTNLNFINNFIKETAAEAEAAFEKIAIAKKPLYSNGNI